MMSNPWEDAVLHERVKNIGIKETNDAVLFGPKLLRDLAKRLRVQSILMTKVVDIAAINNDPDRVETRLSLTACRGFDLFGGFSSGNSDPWLNRSSGGPVSALKVILG